MVGVCRWTETRRLRRVFVNGFEVIIEWHLSFMRDFFLSLSLSSSPPDPKNEWRKEKTAWSGIACEENANILSCLSTQEMRLQDKWETVFLHIVWNVCSPLHAAHHSPTIRMTVTTHTSNSILWTNQESVANTMERVTYKTLRTLLQTTLSLSLFADCVRFKLSNRF